MLIVKLCVGSLALLSSLVMLAGPVRAAEMAMGFRVGEVTKDSAIVWARISRDAERNWDGYRDPQKREPKNNEYTPDKIKVDDREGATPGAPGEIRVLYWTGDDAAAGKATQWVAVRAEDDFIHQFRLTGLKPATKYQLKVEARDGADQPVSANSTGSFGTAAPADTWQDVRFAVITGQSYWDLDHKDGYHMYPAMQQLDLDFLVPTGDTVYLDSESPRARTTALARLHWQRMYSLPRHVELHRFVPGYWEVDDHDVWCNDCWPTMKANWMLPLTYQEGARIYREQVPMGDRTYRTVRWGQGLQVWFVEGRDYRSPNNMADGPEKLIWGKEQLAWLKRTILESDAAFRVLVSPTPIVGPDRGNKSDNHANVAFTHAGDSFRRWTQEQGLKNFFTCCGDRHWQYMSIDPETKLREFSCGPASDKHAGGSPKHDPAIQPFHRQMGGFLTVTVTQPNGTPTILFEHRDVHGKVVNEFQQP